MSDYIGDNESIRLCVARIRIARKKQLDKAQINKHVNAIMSGAPFRVQLMSDLRRLSNDQIRGMGLPSWLSGGMIKLARIPPHKAPAPGSEAEKQATLKSAGVTVVSHDESGAPQAEATTTETTPTLEADTATETTEANATETMEAATEETEEVSDDGLTPEQREAEKRRQAALIRRQKLKESQKKKKRVDKTDFFLKYNRA